MKISPPASLFHPAVRERGGTKKNEKERQKTTTMKKRRRGRLLFLWVMRRAFLSRATEPSAPLQWRVVKRACTRYGHPPWRAHPTFAAVSSGVSPHVRGRAQRNHELRVPRRKVLIRISRRPRRLQQASESSARIREHREFTRFFRAALVYYRRARSCPLIIIYVRTTSVYYVLGFNLKLLPVHRDKGAYTRLPYRGSCEAVKDAKTIVRLCEITRHLRSLRKSRQINAPE